MAIIDYDTVILMAIIDYDIYTLLFSELDFGVELVHWLFFCSHAIIANFDLCNFNH